MITQTWASSQRLESLTSADWFASNEWLALIKDRYKVAHVSCRKVCQMLQNSSFVTSEKVCHCELTFVTYQQEKYVIAE